LSKLKELEELLPIVEKLKKEKKRIVFTNGCFDILHPGHIRLLRQAKSFADILIIGLNSDSSVKKIKGASRPIIKQQERAEVLAALEMVDYIVIFHEADPAKLISAILPDVLVKGGDWAKEDIIGHQTVEENGGEVHPLPYYGEYSTSHIINIILSRFSSG
jgi:D-beta-D-heptose 7-phosphate kinase/D-beta-D-heptose 1-phosphate adenosyltransferase